MSTPNGSGHESTDAKTSPLVGFGVGIVVFTAACALFVFWMLRVLESRNPNHAGPGAISQALPAEPRLQVAEWEDLKVLQNEAKLSLRTYDWVDQKAGTVRIPIERAMDQVVEKKAIPSKAST
jgi:hypothetical protein